MAKQELPGWFPFALAASFLVMVGAGIRSNWGRMTASAQPPPPPGTVPPPPPPPPGTKQAGVLGVSQSRWFFWYVLPRGATAYGARGPEYLTDQEAFRFEFSTKAASLGALLYRFVWIPAKGIWFYDTRNDPALIASREIRDPQGNVVG